MAILSPVPREVERPRRPARQLADVPGVLPRASAAAGYAAGMRPLRVTPAILILALAGCGGSDGDTRSGRVAAGPFVYDRPAVERILERRGVQARPVGRPAVGALPRPQDARRYRTRGGAEFDLLFYSAPAVATKAWEALRAAHPALDARRSIVIAPGVVGVLRERGRDGERVKEALGDLGPRRL